jgi:catechol 2,3-dioxygenase-like lactoylglutathione lyase family enzyme
MMNAATPPAGELFVTQFLVVSDQARTRNFYQSVFGADVVRDRDPVILALANTRIVLNVGGGPTDDKPTVLLAPPADPDASSGFLNLQVQDIAKAYRNWTARGATFLTEPKATNTKSAPTSAIRTVIASR